MEEQEGAKIQEESPISEDENVESSTTEEEQEEVQDVDSESSTEDLAEPTAEEGGQEEENVPFHEHPRWKEVQADKEKAVAEAQYYRGQAEMAKTIPQQQQQAPVDRYAGMDAQTKLFYQEADKRTEEIVQAAVNRAKTEMGGVVQRQAETIGELQAKAYHQENSDIPKDSPEEREIIQKLGKGYTLEDATWSVMGPKRMQEAQRKGTIRKEEKKVMKSKANLATNTLTAEKVPGSKKSFRDSLKEGLGWT